MSHFKFYPYILLILALLSPSLSACAGTEAIAPAGNEILSLQLGSTVWGMQQAIAQKAGTHLMMKDNGILFIWSIRDAWAFTGLNISKFKDLATLQEITGGNVVNAKTMRDLTDFLEQHGWKIVAPKQIPDIVRIGLSSGVQTLARMAQSFSTFLVIPAGLVLPPEELEKYRLYSGGEWY